MIVGKGSTSIFNEYSEKYANKYILLGSWENCAWLNCIRPFDNVEHYILLWFNKGPLGICEFYTICDKHHFDDIQTRYEDATNSMEIEDKLKIINLIFQKIIHKKSKLPRRLKATKHFKFIRKSLLVEYEQRKKIVYCARKIQYAWLNAYYDPSYKICKKRLTREFEKLTRII
jgi:hypothetical protein